MSAGSLGAVTALRAATARAINTNPVTIEVHRRTYEDDGMGGRRESVADLPPIQGRLVPPRRIVSTAQTEAGPLQLDAWVLIAPWYADLRAGSDVEDTFEAGTERYRVTRVIPRALAGERTSVHAELERVR